MAERFIFPEQDDVKFEQNCVDLQDLILHDLEAHGAWLRATGAQEPAEKMPEQCLWEERHVLAILELGLHDAFQRGLISALQLRRLAMDIDLLQDVTDRVYAEGNSDVWQVKDPSCQFADVGAVQEQLFHELAKVLVQQEGERVLPMLHNAELQRTSVGRLITDYRGTICRLDSTIQTSATLTLSWHDRSWGKVRVERQDPTRYRIASKTGVFLAGQLPDLLVSRLAAETGPIARAETGTIQLAATGDGLIIDLVIRT